MSDEPQPVTLVLVSDTPTPGTIHFIKEKMYRAIPVKSVPHLVNTVLAILAAMGNRKIGKLDIYAHGDTNYFVIGNNDHVSEAHHDKLPWLSRLAPHFNPDAEVVVQVIHKGFRDNKMLSKLLSQTWGGIKVEIKTTTDGLKPI